MGLVDWVSSIIDPTRCGVLGVISLLMVCSSAGAEVPREVSIEYSTKDLGPVGLCLQQQDSRVVTFLRDKGEAPDAVATLCADLNDPDSLRSLTKLYKAGADALLDTDTRAVATPTLGVSGELVDNIVRGLAAFVATRAQQEALVVVYDSLQNEVCDVPDRAFWVSNLCTLQLKDVLGAGAAFAGVVRAALLEDLQALPERIVTLAGRVRESAKLPDAIADNALFQRLGAYDADQGIVTLRLGASQAELDKLRELFVAAGLTDVFNRIRDKAAKASDELSAPRELIRILRGVLSGRDVLLLLARLHDVELCSGADTTCRDVERVVQTVGKVARQAAIGLDAAKRQFGDKWPGLDDPRARAIVVAAVRKVVSLSVEDVRVFVDGIAGVERALVRLRTAKERTVAHTVDVVVAAVAVVTVGLDVARRAKSAATVDGIARQGDLTDFVRIMSNAARAVASREYGALLIEAQSLVRLLSRSGRIDVKIPDSVQRFIVLGTSLGSAQSPQEVQSILESTAEAVGGWRLKRRSGVVVSLTAFPGLAAGLEDVQLEGAEDDDAIAGYLFAPVGLDVAFCGSRSFGPGVFFSAIDVGQLLSVPLGRQELDAPTEDGGNATTEVEREDTIRFVQVFSPGIFVRFGILDLPLVVGGGVSYLPRLRTVATDGEGVDVDAVRAIAFVAVDVTIFPF